MWQNWLFKFEIDNYFTIYTGNQQNVKYIIIIINRGYRQEQVGNNIPFRYEPGNGHLEISGGNSAAASNTKKLHKLYGARKFN